MSGTPAPDSVAIAAWLRERLARELGVRPEQIDLERSPDSYGIDSVVGVQICADLGQWIVGRELPADTLLAAASLQAVCEQLGGADVSEPLADEPSRLGAPLAAIDAGGRLVLLARVARIFPPGERHQLVALAREPALVSLAYRHVDETGKVGGSCHYGGRHMSELRPWVQPLACEEGQQFGVFVHNASDRTLELTVIALAREDE